MKKLEANLISNHFKQTSGGYPSDRYIFHRNRGDFNGINIITEPMMYNLPAVSKLPGRKIAWLAESKEIFNYNVQVLKQRGVIDFYEYILTHDKELIDAMPDKFLYALPATNREQVPPHEVAIHEKSKIVSFCFSNKQYAPGHKFRHQTRNFIEAHGLNVDMYGSGVGKPYNGDSMHAYRDYAFSIIIENSQYDNYWSEKPQECFWTGTIPIYRGCESIFDVYDRRGVITFQTLEELKDILTNLTMEDYHEKMEYVKKNFEISQYYRSNSEDVTLDRYAELWGMK